jgi:hypothetical protein
MFVRPGRSTSTPEALREARERRHASQTPPAAEELKAGLSPEHLLKGWMLPCGSLLIGDFDDQLPEILAAK